MTPPSIQAVKRRISEIDRELLKMLTTRGHSFSAERFMSAVGAAGEDAACLPLPILRVDVAGWGLHCSDQS
jgi:chorismate mutase